MTIEVRRGRVGEEAGASPQEGPLGRGETGWMMTSWWTDLTVRTMLQKRRNPNGHQRLPNQKVILIMEKRKRRKEEPGGNKRKCRYPGSFWATRPAKGVAGAGPMTQIAIDQGRRRGRLCHQRSLTEVTLWTTREEEEQAKGKGKGPRKWDGSEDEFKPEIDPEKKE